MASGDRKIPAPDKNLLWAAAGGMCEFPGCGQVLVVHGGTKFVTVGEVAHIYAHSSEGPRFDCSLPATFTESYANWLLLCRKHHRIIDGDEEAFPVAALMGWKETRDERFFNALGQGSYAHLAAPPPLAQHFEERPGLMEALSSSMASGRVALTGLAGSGKTQMAVSYFAEHEKDYGFRWWIRGSSDESLTSDLASLAPLLGVQGYQDMDVKGAAKLVVAELGRRSGWLLILDSVPSLAAVSQYLPAGGDVLVTSQATGWPGFDTVAVSEMSNREATDVLRRRVGAAGVTDVDLDQLAQLCGHHALTLTHVSGYMASRDLCAGRMIQLLTDRRVDVLSRGGGEAPKTLVTAVDLALGELSTDALVLARTLAVVAASPFPITKLSEVPEGRSPFWGDELAIEDAIAELLRFSLIERQGDELLMHELVQHIIWSMMNAEEWHDAILNSTFQVLLHLPSEGLTMAGRTRFERVLPHAHQLIANMESSPVYSYSVAFLLNRIGSYYGDRHELEYGKELLERGLQALEGAEDLRGEAIGHDWTTRASLIHNLGSAEYSRGDLAKAEALVREALALKLTHAPDDDRLIAYSENFLATICHHKGATEEARALFESALQRFRTVGVTVRVAGCLVDLAQLELEEGNESAAWTALEEARGLAEGNVEGADQLLRAYTMLADLQHAHGDTIEALKTVGKAAAILKSLPADDVDLVRVLTTRGRLMMEVGNGARGNAILHEALDILNNSIAPPTVEEGRARGNLGLALFVGGNGACGMEELQRSYDDLASMLPRDHPTVKTAQQMLDQARSLSVEAAGSLAEVERITRKGLSDYQERNATLLATSMEASESAFSACLPQVPDGGSD